MQVSAGRAADAGGELGADDEEVRGLTPPAHEHEPHGERGRGAWVGGGWDRAHRRLPAQVAPLGPGEVRVWTSDADEADGRPARRQRALVVFAGRLEAPVHLPGALACEGFDVDVVDSWQSVGGRAHNVLADGVGDAIIAQVSERRYSFVWIATPCAPYSVVREVKLFSKEDDIYVPPEWRAYRERAVRIAEFTANVIDAAEGARVAWALENPADRSDTHSAAYWPKHADHFPLWAQPGIDGALGRARALRFLFAVCALGADAQKWTCVAACRALEEALAFLRKAGCPHGTAKHEVVAMGVDEWGESIARQCGEYPAELCRGVAQGAARLLLPRAREITPKGGARRWRPAPY